MLNFRRDIELYIYTVNVNTFAYATIIINNQLANFASGVTNLIRDYTLSALEIGGLSHLLSISQYLKPISENEKAFLDELYKIIDSKEDSEPSGIHSGKNYGNKGENLILMSFEEEDERLYFDIEQSNNNNSDPSIVIKDITVVSPFLHNNTIPYTLSNFAIPSRECFFSLLNFHYSGYIILEVENIPNDLVEETISDVEKIYEKSLENIVKLRSRILEPDFRSSNHYKHQPDSYFKGLQEYVIYLQDLVETKCLDLNEFILNNGIVILLLFLDYQTVSLQILDILSFFNNGRFDSQYILETQDLHLSILHNIYSLLLELKIKDFKINQDLYKKATKAIKSKFAHRKNVVANSIFY